MRRRVLVAALLAGGLTVGTALAQTAATWLPTGFSLAPPTGPVAATGTLPVSIALAPGAARAFVVEAGNAPPAVRIIDPRTLATMSTVPLKGAFGTALADPGGAGAWVGTAAEGSLVHIDGARGAVDRTIAIKPQFWPNGIARSPDGTTLAVSGESYSSLALIDERAGTVSALIPVDPHPASVVWSRDGKHVFVAAWSESAIDVVDVASKAVTAKIPVGSHPEALALSPDGARLYAADADSDDVAVVDTATLRRLAIVPLPLHPAGVMGASPNGLAMAPDGKRLYVTCGAANAVAVLTPTSVGANFTGAVPTGWYPTAVAIDGANHAMIVLDGKGERSHPNPEYRPLGGAGENNGSFYVARLTIGSMRRQNIPTDAELAAGTARVRALDASPAQAPPAQTIVRANGPIRHVIYVIKENRTYDQVLGDVAGADGMASLAMFGGDVTPNQHALVARFGVYDRFYTNSQVSADGHNWDDAAIANDYVEKTWPAQYARRREGYDFFAGSPASIPGGGYLWDRAFKARESVRNYGEFLFDLRDGAGPVAPLLPELTKVSDPKFAAFDMNVSDLDRVAEWKREFAAYEAQGNLPALEFIALPNDHTAATSPGMLTPQAYVAQNDVAFGQIVDAVSHSKDWGSTAIFALEDDAQNGPDHVDDQRTTLYVVSPYARAGVHHTTFTTTGVVRTMEIILGLKPMSPYDATARPLYEAFSTTPDLAAYTVTPARIDITAKNTKDSPGAKQSSMLDFTRPDAAPAAEVNAILAKVAR